MSAHRECQPDSDRAKIEARLAELYEKQAAATGWGAAVGARHEEIKSLEGRLAAMNTAASNDGAREALTALVEKAMDEWENDQEAYTTTSCAQHNGLTAEDFRIMLDEHEAALFPPVTEGRETDPLEWLASHANYELSFSGYDEDPAWLVHSVNGGRNDREWTLLATGGTPEKALRKAMSLALPSADGASK
jgi:hypothetical protein